MNIVSGIGGLNTLNLIADIRTGLPGDVSPCPVCAGDDAPFDRERNGTCVGGPEDGMPCDAGGYHDIDGVWTSHDCPANDSKLGELPIHLGPMRTDTVTWTLTEDSPRCANGVGKCFCSTCNDPTRKLCSGHSQCPETGNDIAPTCGGRTCSTGTPIAGPACAKKADCGEGSSCILPFNVPRPSSCLDDTETPDVVEGCEQFPWEPEGEGICYLSTITPDGNLKCFLDNGIVGQSINAVGKPSPLISGGGTIQVATIFCVDGFSFGADAAVGLPGPGRIQAAMKVHQVF